MAFPDKSNPRKKRVIVQLNDDELGLILAEAKRSDRSRADVLRLHAMRALRVEPVNERKRIKLEV